MIDDFFNRDTAFQLAAAENEDPFEPLGSRL